MAKKRNVRREQIPAYSGKDGTLAAGVWRENLIVCVVLVLMVAAVFGQTTRFGFVNYDDDANVYANRVVEKGLTAGSVGWAFTHEQVANWVPLTTLSHMLDCQMFGVRAGGHHLVNVLLHAATAALLFLVLRQMTGSLWRSAFVAAVFAIHPLRAESVAWVSERKDVLSGLFFMLTLWAYARHVRKPSAGGYLVMTLFFGLGLLAKSMVATLPFVLLLLDYWPLGRLENPRQLPGLVVEKIPLFALSVGACAAVTMLAPDLVIPDGYRFPLYGRISNAMVSYVVYLRQMIFPAGLAVPYPYAPNGAPAGDVFLAVLVAISAAVFSCRKKRPYLLMGWLWYLGMLFPVIGIIQISQDAAHADRYTYLPGIGAAIGVTWAVADWSAGWKYRRMALGGMMAGVIGTMMVWAWVQTGYWRDGQTLWKRALACTTGNSYAHFNLGNGLDKMGRINDAIAEYRQALEINPGFALAMDNLGNDLVKNGKVDEALEEYRLALEIVPSYATAHNDLGCGLALKGDWDGAIAEYRKALAIDPNLEAARYNLGLNLSRKGELEEAAVEYRKALEINPDYAEALNGLGAILYARGNMGEAISAYRKALEINPGFAEAHNDMGLALFNQGHAEEAIAEYRKALAIEPQFAAVRNNLGQALIRKGDYDGAMACYEQTTDLGPDPMARWYNLGNRLLGKQDLESAVACFQQAIKINPRSADALANLGVALFQKGQIREAMDSWQQSLAIKPGQIFVQNNLAWALATTPDASLRNGEKAVSLAKQAKELSGGGDLTVLRTLAAAYAEEGQYAEAVGTARLALLSADGQEAMTGLLQNDIKHYEAGMPVRDVKQ